MVENKLQLPKADNLYFYGSGIFDTHYIYDFDTVQEENRYRKLFSNYLIKTYPNIKWAQAEDFLVSGTVDNYSPPKVGSFLSADIAELVEKKKFTIKINNNKKIECELTSVRADFYHFNCGILHFILTIPESEWQNLEVLKRVRFFVQKHQHDKDEFGIDMETIFGPVIKKLKEILRMTTVELDPPLLETPLLDFTSISDEIKTELFWTHSTLVCIMPTSFDVNSQHFQKVLLDINPDGIQNYSITPGIYAYVESGDSLICVPNKSDIRNRTPFTVANEDWVQWIAHHNYTWKTVWELDRGFYVILNLVTSHLKHKRTETYRDVYAVNALLNQLMLFLDTHEPRNMTSTFYSIHFLEKISKSWRTGEIFESVYKKMETLRDLIHQLDEIQETRRGRRVEMFLSLLGVFTLGSLILDFIGSISFREQVPDSVTLSMALGIPFIFMVIAYRLLKD